MKDYLNAKTPLEFARLIRPDLMTLLPSLSLEELEVNEIRKMIFLSYGWRANPYGIRILTKIYNGYTVNLNETFNKISAKIVLGMDKICQSPWFIGDSQITLFNNDVYLELILMDGDVNQLVESRR